jgi:hypothetical protein
MMTGGGGSFKRVEPPPPGIEGGSGLNSNYPNLRFRSAHFVKK